MLKKCCRAVHKYALIFATLLFLAACGLPVPVFAENAAERVRVGYFNYGNFVGRDAEGQYSGYACEFLNRISDFTDWEYDYIPVTMNNCWDWLSAGEIDLLCGVEYSPEREEKCDFTSNAAGTEYALLTVPVDSNAYCYEDFAAFDGIRVGMLRGSIQNEYFSAYAREKGFAYEPFYFETEQNMLAALEAGEVDALMGGSLRVTEKEKVIARFAPTPFYFVTGKGSGLAEKLDFAINDICMDDLNYIGRLYEKYFPLSSTPIVAFTRAEQNYIEKAGTLRVACEANWKPIEYLDADSQKFRGISIDIMNIISQKSGIQFEFLETDSFEQSLEMVQAGRADLVCGCSVGESRRDEGGFHFSKGYLDVPVLMMRRMGDSVGDSNVIIAVARSSGLGHQLLKEYPSAQIRSYASTEECVKALKNGEADVLCDSAFAVDRFLVAPGYEGLEVVPSSRRTHSLCVAVPRQAEEELVSILNKAIVQISEGERNSIILRNTLTMAEGDSIVSFVRRNSGWLVTALVLALLAILVGMLVYFYHAKKILQKYAFTDTLTGARNWTKFEMDAKKLIEQYPDNRYAILELDIDKFKVINDIQGFQVGDQILCYVARILNEFVENDELFCHNHGDHFSVLVHSIDDSELKEKVSYLVDLLCSVPEIGGWRMSYSVSCGIDFVESAANDEIRLASDHANLARRTIKNDYIHQYAFYSQQMRDTMLYEKEIENKMEAALENGEFVVFYQPKFLLADGHPIGAEALVRWKNKDGVLISPDRFVPVFESDGFIVKLDLYVFEEVCKRIRRWIDEGLMPLNISVNLSRVHLYRYDFYYDYLKVMEKYSIPPQLIELELTENAIFDNQERLVSLMHILHEKGFAVSMDDFGSGYSSLNLLKDMPIDVLKIDREFFNVSTNSKRGQKIISNVVRMARELNISVIAEGVETEDQVRFLRDIRCDAAQGYYFARPLPVEELERQIYPHRRRPAEH